MNTTATRCEPPGLPTRFGFIGEVPVSELGVVAVGVKQSVLPIRLKDDCFRDGGCQPSVVGLADPFVQGAFMDTEVLGDLDDRRLRVPVPSDLDDVVAEFSQVGLWDGVYPSRLAGRQARLDVAKAGISPLRIPIHAGAERGPLAFDDDEGHGEVRVVGDREVDVRCADAVEMFEDQTPQAE